MTIVQNIIRPIVQDIVGNVIAFKPTDLKDLLLWLDAQDVSTITSSGDAVSQWSDKSGNSLDVKQTIASRQPLTGNSINGFNAILWDGEMDSIDVLFSDLNPALVDVFATGGTVITVFEATDASGFPRPLTVEGEAFLFLSGTRLGMVASFTVSNSDFRASVSIGAPVFSTVTYDGSSDSNDPSFFRNGVAQTLSVDNNPAGVIEQGPGRIIIGNSSDGGFSAFKGTIGEVILYNRILPANELATIHNSLSSKWNIPLV